jgi:hypothetical protein
VNEHLTPDGFLVGKQFDRVGIIDQRAPEILDTIQRDAAQIVVVVIGWCLRDASPP